MVSRPQPTPNITCPRGVAGEVVGSVAKKAAPSSSPPPISWQAAQVRWGTPLGVVSRASTATVPR